MKTISAEQFKQKYGDEASATVIPPKQTTAFQRVSSRISGAGQSVAEAITGTGQFAGVSELERSIAPTARAFSTIPGIISDISPAPIRQGIDWTSNKIGEGFNYLTGKIADTKLLSDLGKLEADGLLTKDTAPGYFKLKELLGATGSLGEIAGNIAGAKAGVGTINKVIDVTKNVASKVASGTGKITEGALSKITESTANTPADIMQRVARIPKGQQALFEQQFGESVGKYLAKRGMFGDIEDVTTKLYNRFTNSYESADEALSKLTGSYSPEPVKTMLDELLKRETRVSTPGAPSPLLQEVKRLASKNSWDMSEINLIKRMYEKTNKMDYLRQNLPEEVARANNLDSAVRNWQLEQAKTLGLKNLDKINFETRAAKSLLNALGKEYAGSAGNNAITLTDWIMLSGGSPTAISGFLAKKFFSSKYIQAKIAEFVNKGNGILDEVQGEFGPSKVLQLSAPTSSFRSSIGSGPTLKAVPKDKNIDITSKEGGI